MSVPDLIAAPLLIGGSALIALGSLGLIRFPDVLTRMHAATKAATLGVVATTVAAAVEAGALGGILILVLVVALLFLSGPLGMSLLARVALDDPETPLSPNTRALSAPRASAEPFVSLPRRGASGLLGAVLCAIWIALFGSVEPHVVLGGIAVASVLTVAFRDLAPHWPRALLRPLRLAGFAVFFAGRVAVATWGVLATLRLNRSQIRPAVLDVPLQIRGRTELALLMTAVSFTPGTVALELLDGRLRVHVLHVNDPAPAIAEVRSLERRIMGLFATHSPSDNMSLISRND